MFSATGIKAIYILIVQKTGRLRERGQTKKDVFIYFDTNRFSGWNLKLKRGIVEASYDQWAATVAVFRRRLFTHMHTISGQTNNFQFKLCSVSEHQKFHLLRRRKQTFSSVFVLFSFMFSFEQEAHLVLLQHVQVCNKQTVSLSTSSFSQKMDFTFYLTEKGFQRLY